MLVIRCWQGAVEPKQRELLVLQRCFFRLPIRYTLADTLPLPYLSLVSRSFWCIFTGSKLLTVRQQLFRIPCDLGDRINSELTDMPAPEDLLSSHLFIIVDIQQCE